MRISFRIALPVAALGFLGVAAAGWLTWTAVAGLQDASAAERRAAAATGHLATVRESRRLASDLAIAALDPGRASDGLSRLVQDTAAAALSGVETMRADAAGQDYRPAIDRLSDATRRWRDRIESVARRPGPEGRAAAEAAEAIAAESRIVGQLAGAVAARVARAEAARARDGRSAALRRGTAAAGAIFLAALCLGGAALRRDRRLARDMAGLPGELRSFAEKGWAGLLPGEGRRDEFGTMVRELRGLAGKMREMAKSRAEMERMALSDPLTGLPNRRALYDFLARRGGRRSAADRNPLAVMNIDLDHFKTINDANGHDSGDFVLREATRRMALVIRDSDILARVGGDEFVIVAQGVTSLASLQRLAERVIRQFDEPIVLGDRSLRVTVSIGAVLGGRRGRLPDPKRLLINADLALAHAKASGRNRWSVFTSAMARGSHDQQERGAEIRRAVERAEFHVWYRPVMDIPSGRPVALDMVTRWHHPERGVLPANAFIEAAEAHALTESLAFPAFDRAFRQVGQWLADGLHVPTLHIGISRTVLLSPSVVDTLSWMLDNNRIDPATVAISFSELYCSGRGVEAVLANLRRLADLGAGVVIDDFGSVDAAIGNITRLGAGQIKFNVARTGGLVDGDGPDTATGARMQALLPGIIGIGESLGVSVLAKRVDTGPQMESMLARGFARMQGDAVAPAMDGTTAGEWLARFTPDLVRAAAG